MPPKPKFTKEEIVETALSIVSENGINALTARELGAKLNSSARPVFTAFKNMEELQCEVKKSAMAYFESFEIENCSDMPVFKQVGMRMISFGMNEPKLYQLIFMSENQNVKTFDDILKKLGSDAELCIKTVCNDYGLSEQEAKLLFENMWIYTFGIGTLCATKACRFSKEEVDEMLSLEFQAMMMLIKSKKL